MITMLDGIKIIDMTQVAAGPACTMFLGDMGASVIKVEPPSGELGRMLGPPFINGESVIFLSLNRNKRGMAIDLKTKEGVDIIYKMVAESDIFVESFRPGVTRRLGIDGDTLIKKNPKLIYCSISAYGQTGPWSSKPGVDGIIQGSSGLMSVIGEEGGPVSKVQAPIIDLATAFSATSAVLGALFARERTGRGQKIDVSMQNAAIMLQQTSIASFLASGRLPEKQGSAAPYAAPNEAVRTKDGHIMIAAYQPEKWNSLCKITGREHLLEDPRFRDNPSRIKNRKDLISEFEKVFVQKSSSEWLRILEKESQILCGPVANYEEVVNSEQAFHDEIIIDIEHPVSGHIKIPGFGIKLSEMPAVIRLKPPLLGEHTREILEEYEYNKEQVRSLFERKVVG